ncbi:MAG: hypothetical protein Q9P01_02170 [Anaerolineae bacterium]|nr:hypothetical protein [Anaerolineae bacterium]MDQ7033665.1 hypothetical protein [Anaerolineae bacterium]
MSYYKRKKDEVDISVNRALWAVLMLVVLFGGFMARDTLRSALFDYQENVDVNGEWIGLITEDYDAEIRYEYRLTFNQSEDGSITGNMHIQSTNRSEDIIADSIVSGSISNDDLTFSETRVTYLDGVSPSNWCRISVSLDYEVINGQETLTGDWAGIETPGVGSCAGTEGRVILTREP